jgi:hypothetical protein
MSGRIVITLVSVVEPRSVETTYVMAAIRPKIKWDLSKCYHVKR